MNSKLAISYLVVGGALMPIGAHAADPGQAQEGPKTFTQESASAQDSAIPAQIKAEMAAEHVASLSHISVDTDASGVVSLTGYALSQDDIDKTVSIARSTTGVTAVKNSLTVKTKG